MAAYTTTIATPEVSEGTLSFRSAPSPGPDPTGSDSGSDEWLLGFDKDTLHPILERRRSDPREQLGAPNSSASDTMLPQTRPQPDASRTKKGNHSELGELIRESVAAGIADFHKNYVAPIEAKISKLEHKVQTVNKTYHESIQEIIKENKNLNRKITDLEKKISNNNRNQSVANTNTPIPPMQVTMKTNNLIIHGLTEERNENTIETVKKFTSSIDVEITQIQARRIGSGGCRPIIVEFATIWEKRKLYASRIQLKGKGYGGVFINEDLTTDQAEIYYNARQARKQKLINTTWTMGGVTHIAKIARSGKQISLPVTSLDQLKELIPRLNITPRDSKLKSQGIRPQQPRTTQQPPNPLSGQPQRPAQQGPVPHPSRAQPPSSPAPPVPPRNQHRNDNYEAWNPDDIPCSQPHQQREWTPDNTSHQYHRLDNRE